MTGPVENPSPEYLAESKVTLLYAFYSLPIPLEVLSTLFRVCVKAGNKGALAFDDYLMVFATIVSVGVCISGLVYGPPYGLGRHIEAVPEEDVAMLLMGDYIFSHFYNMAIGTTKLSVLALYHRIFAIPKFRIAVFTIAAFTCAWIIVMEVVLGFGCRPLRAWWGNVAPGEAFTCVDKVAFTYFTNVTNLTLDLLIFSMPIPVLLKLQVTTDRRISLLFLFSVGLGTCAISAARLSFVFGVSDYDFTWYIASLGILSAWEPCGGILCANLPLVYRAIIQMGRTVRSTITSTSRRRTMAAAGATGSGGSTGTQRSSKPVFANDWKRLDGGGLGVEENPTVSEAYAMRRGKLQDYELNSVEPGRIVVSTTFHQEL